MTPDRWLAVFGIAASGLLSWLFSRHYYRRTEKRRVPTFVINPRRNLLADAALANLRDFSIRHRHQDVGESGVTQVEVHFWNSGDLPITSGDVLEPFTIVMPARVLQCSIVKASRNVTAISTEVLQSETEIRIGFSVLEPGDGATIKIIYDGPPNAETKFKGACIGAAKPTVLPPSPTYFKPVSRRLLDASQPLVSIAASAGLWGALILLAWVIMRLFGERALAVVAASFFGIIVLIVLGILGWERYKEITAKYIPPEIRS